MNELLISMLSDPARSRLLHVVDAAVGSSPNPSDLMRIRKLVPTDIADSTGVLVDIVLGTRKARRLGKAVDEWWYTTLGAEQGTHPEIAKHHADRFSGCKSVVEICAGNGMDTAALARVAKRVVTYEADAVTAALTIGNLNASGISNVHVLGEHVSGATDIAPFDGLWADPSRRRADGSRSIGIKEYSPPLETLLDIGSRFPSAVVGIKCGPGDTIPGSITNGFSNEFVGFAGECRERILWRNADLPSVLVSLPQLTKSWSPPLLVRVNADSKSLEDPTDSITHEASSIPRPGDTLVEPHPALIASGALDAFLEQHGLRSIHPKIAYAVVDKSQFKSDAVKDWVDAFEVLRVDSGISERRIQQNLRDLHWSNRTEFKKRGWNGEPEALRRSLQFADSDDYGVVIIARTDTGHITMFCKRISNT